MRTIGVSARAVSGGGRRKTTLVPEFAGAGVAKSPTIPAANDKVVNASATASTRMEVEKFKAISVN